MKIVIAGAGGVGYHLAQMLCRDNYDLTVIDNDPDVLERVDRSLDALPLLGDASSPGLLDQAEVGKADLFLAVTTSESVNLLSAMLAKTRGTARTVARVNDPEKIERASCDTFRSLGIDDMICPQQLVAYEIDQLLQQSAFTDLSDFEDGALHVVGITLPLEHYWTQQTIGQISKNFEESTFRVLAVLRGRETILPAANFRLLPNDHLYVSLLPDQMEKLGKIFDKRSHRLKRVMIMGSTAVALRTAQVLEDHFDVLMAVRRPEIGKRFLQHLTRTTVVHAAGDDIEALRESGLEEMDAYVALSNNSETNIISSIMSERVGVHRTIAMVDNVDYVPISQNIGIDTIINMKLTAANNIFQIVRGKHVAAVATLHGVDAEIVEYVLAPGHPAVGQGLNELNIPQECAVAGIVRGNQGIIPPYDYRIHPGDKLILMAPTQHVATANEIFGRP